MTHDLALALTGRALSSSRRAFLRGLASAGALACAPELLAGSSSGRRFNVCLSPGIVENQPDLVDTVRDAGVHAIWLADFFYGHHPFPLDQILAARRRVERAGLEAHIVNVPLGHPGDSLGAKEGNFPLTPPSTWQAARRPDGRSFVGTSLHEPATHENVIALQHLHQEGFKRAFLDDDFRLARGPGEIGGCFCAAHQARFLRRGGHGPSRWIELVDDVRARRFSRLLKEWVQFVCDELSDSFRAQQRAFRGALGNMIMYLGAEKAGIRLTDYKHIPVRVGELMFDDASFGTPKGKTDELFSVLFHRRFVDPQQAYSETTAYPAHRLSATNMAAKLVISTLADVRQTMFMSGLTPFPSTHWSVLKDAIRHQTALHRLVAGHALRGPFRHYWGEAERHVGDDRPFSLWLALGIPFEVSNEPAPEGWTFLSDFDAREGSGLSAQTQWVCRPSATIRPGGARMVAETLTELFAFKRSVREALESTPHVLEELPAVCAWFPSARRAIVWNLSDARVTLTLRNGRAQTVLEYGPLEAKAVELA